MIQRIYRVSEVVHIVDGDTIDLELDLGFGVKLVERFRLAGIQAPELRRETMEAARAASVWLETNARMLASASKLYVESVKADGFRRWLGTLLELQNDHTFSSLNQKMINEGIVKPYLK